MTDVSFTTVAAPDDVIYFPFQHNAASRISILMSIRTHGTCKC
jgi:hypothetical protein